MLLSLKTAPWVEGYDKAPSALTYSKRTPKTSMNYDVLPDEQSMQGAARQSRPPPAFNERDKAPQHRRRPI